MNIHLYTSSGGAAGKSLAAYITLAYLLEYQRGDDETMKKIIVFDANKDTLSLYQDWLNYKEYSDFRDKNSLTLQISPTHHVKVEWFTICGSVCVVTPVEGYSDELLFPVLEAFLQVNESLEGVVPITVTECLVDTGRAIHTITEGQMPTGMFPNHRLITWILWTPAAISSHETIMEARKAIQKLVKVTENAFTTDKNVIHVFNPQFRETKPGRKEIVDMFTRNIVRSRSVPEFANYYNKTCSDVCISIDDFARLANAHLRPDEENPSGDLSESMEEFYNHIGEILVAKFTTSKKRYVNIFTIPIYDYNLADFRHLYKVREDFFGKVKNATRNKDCRLLGLAPALGHLCGKYYKEFLDRYYQYAVNS